MAKILIVSHSPYSSTGYGRVVRGLAGSLQAAGNQIVCLGTGNNSSGSKLLPYPVVEGKGIAAQVIGETIKSHHVDVLLTIGDPWMFEAVPVMPERRGTLWMAYFPIDGYPLPAHWKTWVLAVDVPVVFSKFARDVVKTATGKTPELIYHGVNTRTFSPVDREKAKELANVGGHFVVGTVARNQMRKNIPALIKAFARFAKGKDDALLYLHTQLKGEFDIAELVRTHGIVDKTRITGEIGPDKGVTDQLLATVYRAMDVFVLPTMAEGFGLPIMESQACGTPALVTDFSACPELVPDPIQRLKVKDTLTMARNFEQAIVDVDDIAEKLELLYRDRERLKALGERCHQFAQSFEWEIAYRQFNELLASERFESILAARKANRGKPTASINAGPFSQKQISPSKPSQNGNNAAGHAATVGTKGPEGAGKVEPFDEVERLHANAVAKIKAGALSESVSLLQRVVQLRPSNPEFQNRLAVVLQADGKLDEAIQCYRRSLELRPRQHQVWTNLANAHLMAGNLVNASEACARAIELAPGFAPAHDIRGMIFLKQGDAEGAKLAYEKALVLMPEHKAAQLHLAELAGSRDGPRSPTLSPIDAVINEGNALRLLNEAVAGVSPCPGGFEGRGVVIVGGGIRYFPCAWVCIRMLRECGCVLPIELWHLGNEEMTAQMCELVAKYGVTCIDGRAKAVEQHMNDLGGWELKPFSIMHSRFREVLLLDADNFPLVDPEFLFDATEYLEHGAVFWPDYGKLKADDRMWELTGVLFQDERAFESGQVLIDKTRCWEPLLLTMWFNRNSNFWYRYIFGDKDTFHFAWRKLDRLYAMPTHGVSHLPHAMAQHDFTGRRIFQHRNRAKWVLSGWNPRMEEFEKEDRGFAFLNDLRELWNPDVPAYNMAATERVQQAWKHYDSTYAEAAGLLSAIVGGDEAWKRIGEVAKHTARCIMDAHTVSLLKGARDAAPQVAELHAMLGTTLGTLGRHGEAMESFRLAGDLCPDLPGLRENLKIGTQSMTSSQLGGE
jgi:glycosyltransferase involved in cell wall biosynthesis